MNLQTVENQKISITLVAKPNNPQHRLQNLTDTRSVTKSTTSSINNHNANQISSNSNTSNCLSPIKVNFFKRTKNHQLQNHQKKKQLLNLEQINNNLNQKIYSLQIKEDELLLQNQKLKNKLSLQSKLRSKNQQEIKELQYQIDQYNDMLNQKENYLKIKIQEAHHWRSQFQYSRHQLHSLRLQLQKTQQKLNFAEQQKQKLIQERDIKEEIQQDLKYQVEQTMTENSKLRQNLYHIGKQLREVQHQNCNLNIQLKNKKHGKFDYPDNLNYLSNIDSFHDLQGQQQYDHKP